VSLGFEVRFFITKCTLAAVSFFFRGADSLLLPWPVAVDAGGGIDPRSEGGSMEDPRTPGDMNEEGDEADGIGEAWRDPDSVALCNRRAGLLLPPEGTRLTLGGRVMERDRGRSSTKLSNSSSTSTSIKPSARLLSNVSSTSSDTAISTSISSSLGSTLLAGTRTEASSASRATAASGMVAGTKGEVLVTCFVFV
jgi:hypothetical protein